MRPLAIIGTGGHARECIEAARAAGREVGCLLDEDPTQWGTMVHDVRVAEGGLSAIAALSKDVELLIAVGDNQARARIASQLSGLTFATLVHPFSWVSPTARISDGAMIFAGCVIQSGATVGQHGILNTSASLSHDCAMGDFSHVAVGAHLAGNVTVGEGALIGAGVAARPGVSIGSWATVGAGSAVVADVPDGKVVYGNANARPQHELLVQEIQGET